MTVTSSKRINLMLSTAAKYFWATALTFQYVYSAPLSSAVITDWSQHNVREHEGKGTYSFRYDIEDPETNNIQFRSEERHPNGTVTGSYGYLEADGNIHMVHYIADARGYRATVENSARGGMLKPIPVLDDIDYTAYGYTPEMIAALKSQQILNKKQQVHEQRLRPIDQPNNQADLEFQLISNQNQLNEDSSSARNEQNQLRRRLQQPLQQALAAGYPFNYGNIIGNDGKSDDNLDFFSFA